MQFSRYFIHSRLFFVAWFFAFYPSLVYRSSADAVCRFLWLYVCLCLVPNWQTPCFSFQVMAKLFWSCASNGEHEKRNSNRQGAKRNRTQKWLDQTDKTTWRLWWYIQTMESCFLNWSFQAKRKSVQQIGVKWKCSTERRETGLGSNYGDFRKAKVRGIGIPQRKLLWSNIFIFTLLAKVLNKCLCFWKLSVL